MKSPLVCEAPPSKLYVYGDVPPEATTLREPVDSPKHATSTTVLVSDKAAAGSPTVSSTSRVQSLESVIVTVYVPAANPVKSPVSCEITPSRVYDVYGGVPPEATTLIEPVDSPKHATSTIVLVSDKAAAGSPTVRDTSKVHPLSSVIVTVYVPAANPVKSPLACEAPPSRLYVYGEVPPEATTLREPVDSPKHATSVISVLSATNAPSGWVTVALVSKVQSLESVTTTVYTPATRSSISSVIAPLLQS